jgi:endonuclease YncB( thermonuclease family)
MIYSLICASALMLQTAFSGTVTEVLDGDTFKLTAQGVTVTIRIAHIDAPEKSQAYGTEATAFTSSQLLGKTVSISKWKLDQYGRTVGEVRYGNGRNFSHEIVKRGLAWHYKTYSNDAEIDRAEKLAKAARRGLWADTKPVAPWSFRQNRRSPQSSEAIENKRFIDSLFKAKPYLGIIIKHNVQ